MTVISVFLIVMLVAHVCHCTVSLSQYSSHDPRYIDALRAEIMLFFITFFVAIVLSISLSYFAL
jgi:hypothetical protein